MGRKVVASIQGKVNNFSLKKTNILLPVFEAIANSLYAIEQVKENNKDYNGSIEVVLERKVQLGIDYKDSEVHAIIVKDNGVGFNPANMESFLTSDSTFKKKIGGKGNGRFSWLKVFNNVLIKSVYEDGGFFERSFEFNINTLEINDVVVESNNNEIGTIVTMVGIDEKYTDVFDRDIDVIAEKIIQAFVIYLLDNDCPKIVVRDNEKTIDINELFRQSYLDNACKDEFVIDNYVFTLTSLKITNQNFGHNYLYFCANKRLVQTRNLEEFIVNLNNKIYEKEGYWYLGILSGDYLNENVDYNRQSFSIDEEDASTISLKKITTESLKLIKNQLSNYLENVNNEKIERIKTYVQKVAPEYRHLMKYRKDDIDKIKPGLTDNELDDSLFAIKREFEKETNEECTLLLDKVTNGNISIEAYETQFEDTIKKITDINQSDLSRYIAKRRAVLNLFRQGISMKSNGKFELEKYIHQLIFPMKKDIDEIDYNNHNLWLIDEKLAYSVYVSSDVPFNNDQSEKRPDIMVLNNPVAVSDNEGLVYNTISIFELKKPDRNDYTLEDNPISQLLNYVDKIKGKKARDKHGRIINCNDSTQFFLYAVCDITPTLSEVLKRDDFTPTENGCGAFAYKRNYNAYIEVLSYDKLLNDSEARNRVFFEKLGIK